MKEQCYFKMKAFWAKALVLVALCIAGAGSAWAAGSGLTKEDPLILEVGEQDVSASKYKSLYATFTAPSDGVLTLTLIGTDVLELYTDDTYTVEVEPVLEWINNYTTEIEVREGQTYYFYRKWLMNANKLKVEFGDQVAGLELKKTTPESGTTLSASRAQVSFAFNRNVQIGEATLTACGKTVTIEPVALSNIAQFDLGSVLMDLYHSNGLKAGDDLVITLSGVCNEAKKEDLYHGDGICSVTLKAAAKPVELTATVNTPGNGMDVFPSYIMQGKNGIVQLQFDGALKKDAEIEAHLIYGDVEAENGYYDEKLEVAFFGDNILGIPVHSKMRRHKDMLPNYTGAAFEVIALKVSGLYGSDGQAIYSTSTGGRASYTCNYDYEEVKYDIAAAFDDQSIDGLDSLTVWVRGDEYLQYKGVQFDFVEGGQAKSVVVSDIKKHADEEEAGAVNLRIPVPDENRDADTEVKVSFVGLQAADGLDYTADFTKTFKTAGHTVAALAIVASDPVDGSTLEKLAKASKVTIKTNRDKSIGCMIYSVYEYDPANPEEKACIKTQAYMMAEGEAGFSNEISFDYMLYENRDYEFVFTAYASENDEIFGRTPIGEVSLVVHGASKPFEYSPVELLEITPDPSVALTSVADSVVTLKFSGPVDLTSETTFHNMGQGESAPLASISSNEDKTEWRLAFTESSMEYAAVLWLSVAPKDENGLVVKGNTGEGEQSYFLFEYSTPFNAKQLSVTPEPESQLKSIKEVIFEDETGLAEYSSINGKIEIWDKATRNVVATAELVEQVIPEDKLDDFSYTPTQVRVVFDKEITEPGAYTLHVPADYFIMGEQMSTQLCQETFINYYIVGEAAQTCVPQKVEATVEDNAVTGFTVTCSTWVTLDESYDHSAVKIENKESGEEWVSGKLVDYNPAVFEAFDIVLENPITEKGTYLLILPEKMFGDDSWVPGDSKGSCNPLLYYTIEFDGTEATVGVKSVSAASEDKVTVYTLNGVRVLYQAEPEALKTLKKGIYVVNGKKVVIK